MELEEKDGLVLLERQRNGVASLILHDPPLNLMTVHMNECLDRVLDEIAADEDIRVVLLLGAGDRAFSAGAHVKEFADFVHRGTMISDKLELECKICEKLNMLPQPTIAAMHGITLGGGIELALCCDYRILGESVEIGYPEIKLGLFPGGGGLVRLPEIIGLEKAKEILFLGTSIPAAEALRLGLVNEVLPDSRVIARAQERAGQLAKLPGYSLRAIKKGIDNIAQMPVFQGVQYSLGLMSRLLATKDAREGINAFLEKREPKFNER